MRGALPRMVCTVFSVMQVVLWSHEGRADYSSLLREMDEYQPPVVVSQPMTTTFPPIHNASPPTEQEFQNQVAALQKQQKEWIRAVNEPRATHSFLLPNAALLQALHSAANDNSAAAKAVSGLLTIETLEALVLLRSPVILAKESEFKAVLEGYSQAEDLDTILRRYASFSKSLMTGTGSMNNPDPVAFKFPFPGVLALKGEIVTQEAQAAWEDFEAARRDAVTEIRREYAELLYSHRALSITETELQLLISLHETVSARYEAGKASFAELTSIAVEQERAVEAVRTIREEITNNETAIRASLLLPESVRLGRPAPFKPSLSTAKPDDLYPIAMERRQELKAKRALIGRMERMLEMAETMIYPGFSQELALLEGNTISQVSGLGLKPATEKKGDMAENDGGFPVTTAGSTASGIAKMPWFGTDDAYLRQTRQRIDSLKNELAASTAATMLGVRQAWFRVDKAKREQALFQERVIPLSQANLDSATQSYATGQVGFAELINSTNRWLDANIALARTEADLITALAELDAAVGVDQAGGKITAASSIPSPSSPERVPYE